MDNGNKYKELINDSPFFGIDKEREYSRYKTEKYKLLENIYYYLKSIDPDNELYGYEIACLFEKCLESFSPCKGEFIHYFMASWKLARKNIFIEDDFERQYRGLISKENQIKRMKAIKKYLKNKGIESLTPEIIQKISSDFKTTDSKLKYLIEDLEMAQKNVDDGYVYDENGEETDLIEQISSDENVEDNCIAKQNMIMIFDCVQEIYQKEQQRVKPILSDYITSVLFPYWSSAYGVENKYSFWSDFAIAVYKKRGKCLTNREIAIRYDRNESSISRTISTFIQKVKQKYNE